jgi:hypothetical protein
MDRLGSTACAWDMNGRHAARDVAALLASQASTNRSPSSERLALATTDRERHQDSQRVEGCAPDAGLRARCA